MVSALFQQTEELGIIKPASFWN